MDKFLQLCFKIGKWVSSGLLALLFIIGLCLGCFVLDKSLSSGNYKINYKVDKKGIEAELDANSGNKNDNKKTSNAKIEKDNLEEYKEIIKKAVKGTALAEQLSVDKMASYVDKYVDEKDARAFIKHFPAYYNTIFDIVIKQVKKNNPNLPEDDLQNSAKGKVLDMAWRSYCQQYDDQVELREAQKEQNKANRLIGIYAFLITLAIFIIMLFFPILLKIEENTRK